MSAALIAKTAKFWAALAAGLLGAGFSAAMYLSRYAAAADVQRVDVAFQKHVVDETSRVTAVEEQGRHIEEDYHWQREQLSRIAERVGAERVPAPKH